MKSILDGVRKILDQNLADNRMNSEVLEEAIKQIKNNWHGNKTSSKKNWELRFVPLPEDKSKQIKGHGHKAEVPLERTIAKAFFEETKKNTPSNQTPIEKTLWNQMPVASGLVKNSSKGRRRAVDLIYKPDASKKRYEFLELKVGKNKKDTSRDAALEVIEYGLLYLFSRQYMEKLGYSPDKTPILGASHIGLRVLAEREYYENQMVDSHSPLLDKLNKIFNEYLKNKPKEFGKLTMDFRFETFPSKFKCPEIDSTKLDENLMDSLRKAIRNKKPY